MKKKRAFTLIELLMTVALISVIGMVLYTSLSTGISVAQRISRPVSDEDLAIFFEKMTREVSSALPYSGIGFHGKVGEFSFPSTIHADEALGGSEAIGKITYYYHSSINSLERAEQNMSEAFKEIETKPVTVMTDVRALSFEYFGVDKDTKQYQWYEEWDSVENEGAFPVAVKIKMEYYDDKKNKHELFRSIPVPVGG